MNWIKAFLLAITVVILAALTLGFGVALALALIAGALLEAGFTNSQNPQEV